MQLEATADVRVGKLWELNDAKNKMNGGATCKISYKGLRLSSELQLSLKSCLNWYYKWEEILTAHHKGFS